MTDRRVEWRVVPRGRMLTLAETLAMPEMQVEDHYKSREPQPFVLDDPPAIPLDFEPVQSYYLMVIRHQRDLLAKQKKKTGDAYVWVGTVTFGLLAVLTIVILNAFNVIGH